MTAKDEGIRIVSGIVGSRPAGHGFVSVKFRAVKKHGEDKKKHGEDETEEKFEKEKHKVDVTA